MTNASRDAWIVFNGEIYNFPQLRKELISKGRKFLTDSDTEVILEMYREYGDVGIARLNGIFAFAIYDSLSHAVTLARDQFGVKPLYYRIEDGILHFASEIKAILVDSSLPRELDFEALNSFLTFRYSPSPQTLFRSIRKLPPGYMLRVGLNGHFELRNYSHYVPKSNLEITEPEAVEEYQRLMEQAVRRQMLSDVPVGLFLSGGIDSAAIGYLMQQEAHKPIQTFTIGFEGKGDYNETADARTSARFLGTEHYELTISKKEYLDFFFRSFYYVEEPIAQTTISALYYVSRLAASHVKVVLAGQGADEPLAGYNRYIGEKYIAEFGSLLRMLPLEAIASVLPRNERVKRAAYASQFESEAERFLGIYTIFTPSQKKRLLLPDLFNGPNNVDLHLVKALYDQATGVGDSLAKILYIDTRMSLSDNLLLFGDKMTMANSLEMRVPFLDFEFIHFIESLPSSMKLKGRNRKYIHKKALTRWLPEEFIYRKKRGFLTPMDQWLQERFADTALKVLSQPNSLASMLFDMTYVNEIVNKHRLRKENFQIHIFALLSLELWYQTFFLGKQISFEEFDN
jgi:asparagine synthase (glutamine-hydrolysing)